jgi:hypothetical protein
MEMHTAEPLVPDHSLSKVEIAISKFKRYKSPDSDQILTELTEAEGETLWSEIHKLVNHIWSEEEFYDQWKRSIIL